MDWPDSDYRLFIGNLGNEVTDLVLNNTFRRYNSFSKARVIRDKRSQKTKGYGFVSFMDEADYIRAYKEMNGKYIGNRPCKITASKWRERTVEGYEEKMLTNTIKDEDIHYEFKKSKIRKVAKPV